MYNILIVLKINKFIAWISIIVSLTSFVVVFFFYPSTFIDFFRIELFDIFPNVIYVYYSIPNNLFNVEGYEPYLFPEIKEYLILGPIIVLISTILFLILFLKDYFKNQTKKINLDSLMRWFIALYLLFFILSFINAYIYLPDVEIVKFQISKEYASLFYPVFMWILFSLTSFLAVLIATYYMASSFGFKKFFYLLGFFLILFTMLLLSHRILFYGLDNTIGITHAQLILTLFLIILEFVFLNIYLFLKKKYNKNIIKQSIGVIVLHSLIVCMLFVPVALLIISTPARDIAETSVFLN